MAENNFSSLSFLCRLDAGTSSVDIQGKINAVREELQQFFSSFAEPGEPGDPEDTVLSALQTMVEFAPPFYEMISGTEILPAGQGSLLCSMCVAGYLGVVRFMIETGGKDPFEPMACPTCQQRICKFHDSVYHFKSGPLLISISFGQLEVVKYLVSRAGPRIFTEDDFGYLATAADKGDVEMVRYLLESGAKADAIGFMGCIPICAASHKGHLEVVRLLIAAGVDVNKPNKDGKTPLAAAAMGGFEGSPAVMRALIEAGADLEPPNDEVLSPLQAAAFAGSLAGVKFLIGAGGDVSRMYCGAWTPLALAAHSGELEMVRFLATLADINQPCGTEGWNTAAHFAAGEGHTAVVRCLIEAGVDVQEANIYGVSLLHAAAEAGHTDLVSYLLSVGANKEALTAKGISSLQRAAGKGHLEVVRRLVGELLTVRPTSLL